MHFWIDKRSQACSISGRYRSSAPGVSTVPRHRGGAGGASWGAAGGCKVGGLVMVTPVHRFQPIESVQASYAHRRGAHHHRHRQGPANILRGTSHSAAPRPAHDVSIEVPEVAASNGGASLGSASSTGPQHHNACGCERHTARKPFLGCGLWAALALLSVFVLAVWLYVDHIDHKRLGIVGIFLVVCALPLLRVLAGYCSSRAYHHNCFTARAAQARAHSHNSCSPGPRSTLIEVPEEETPAVSLVVAQHTQPWVQPPSQILPSAPSASQSQQPAPPQETMVQLHRPVPPHPATGEPPPYHIAIWLPHPEDSMAAAQEERDQEVPPPSYDNVAS